MADAEVDVVIVGAGPTGLTGAHLCRRLGLSAVVLEKRPGPQRSPAAHVVNARSFEIWRQAGVDMAPIHAACLSPAEGGMVHWVTKLGATPIGSLPFEQQGDDMFDVTPTPLRNLSQHRLEPLLSNGNLDIRYETTWTDASEDDTGIVVSADGPDGPTQLRARYLIGADGAASPVCRWAGIERVGPRTIQSFVMIHLAADFTGLVGDHAGVLHWVVDPRGSGTFVSHGADREWVFMHSWDANAESVDAFTPSRCADIVRRAIDGDAPEFEIRGISTWHMSAQVASSYRVGRTFLAGDAAHRFPPTGGLGLNTGVADIHNLVWKLNGVINGWLPPWVLDTYEAERKPVAEFNNEQSMENAFKLIEVPIALGMGPDIDESVAAMAATLADPAALEGVHAAIRNQALHFDLLGLQLGATYDGSLVVDDGSATPVVEVPARDYAPTCRPGGRLPHAWLADGRSTLDLLDPTQFTLLHHAERPRAVEPAFPCAVVAVETEAWERAFDTSPTDVVIVRPDQHVIARGDAATATAAVASALTAP